MGDTFKTDYPFADMVFKDLEKPLNLAPEQVKERNQRLRDLCDGPKQWPSLFRIPEDHTKDEP